MAEGNAKRQKVAEEEYKDFDPTSVGLSEGFLLTKYAKLKG
jgi:hypothetical protein